MLISIYYSSLIPSSIATSNVLFSSQRDSVVIVVDGSAPITFSSSCLLSDSCSSCSIGSNDNCPDI